MKFAKELEEELVPEWKVKYFNYKLGKKKIKAIQRAIQTAQRSPLTPLRRTITPKQGWRDAFQNAQSKRGTPTSNAASSKYARRLSNTPSRRQSDTFAAGLDGSTSAGPIDVPREGLASSEGDFGRRSSQRYNRHGSIIGSPPSPPLSRPTTLNLPDPAIDPASDEDSFSPSHSRAASDSQLRFTVGSASANEGSAFEVGKTKHPSRAKRALIPRRHSSQTGLKSPYSSQRATEPPLLKRIFSGKQPKAPKAQRLPDVPLEAVQEIDEKESDFYEFLDTELDKIESFYKSKEEESSMRLDELKRQLHALRDQRDEIEKEASRLKDERRVQQSKDSEEQHEGNARHLSAHTIPAQLRNMEVLQHPLKSARQVHFGKPPKPNNLVTPPDRPKAVAGDYVRRPESPHISYQQAKRRLRIALQEYYRGLELLKAYALSNRTAFRKINKKYDKAVRSRNTMTYMNEKVNSAWFVQSTVVDKHISAVEDLYARYFEKGSHKLAVGKLRRKSQKPDAFDRSVFRNGLTLAAALVFGLEGLVYGADIFYAAEGVNPILEVRTSYLLQFYAAYFLLVFLTLFFCLDCYIFTRAKVNYVFVFEFDTRHNLDWRQLCELPCLFALLLGLTMWLNFSLVGGSAMYLWWPVVLVGLSVLIMFLPLPILYHKSRKWFVYSCWRLLGAGIYPVEFRDFFLGDMFCSQTYTFGGIELFFCIYANSWRNPSQCNSSSSMLLGFLTTLPGIMRLLQCLRRYYDTRNIFPHLVNGGKYSFTILQYTSLSVYRINEGSKTRAFFITCAAINATYCSIWDLVMDWSLMDPEAERPFLRRHLAYKAWYCYYAAMIIDPIIRFNWIFYAVPFFADEIQHSALLGFLVSFSEVIRRGIWTLFRVENEHCTNVGRFRASRDVPLPYKLESSAMAGRDYERRSTKAETGSKGKSDTEAQDEDAEDITESSTTLDRTHSGAPKPMLPQASDPESGLTPAMASGADLDRVGSRETAMSSLRRRQQQQQTTPKTPAQSIRARVGTILHSAHVQDFERRKKDDGEDNDNDGGSDTDSLADADDSDNEDADDENGTLSMYATRQGRDGASGSHREDADGNDEEDAERERRQVEDGETSLLNQLDVQSVRNLLRRAGGGDG